MKIFRWIVAVLAVVVTLLRIGLYLTLSDIDVAPEIKCEKEIFEVTCDTKDEELLKYVTATDAQDGEIDNIAIERMYFLTDNKSKITFVAIDSDKNITKLTKDIIYTDYIGPRIYAKTSGIFYLNDRTCRFPLTAEDQFSGDISSRVKIISNNFSNRQIGNYKAQARVSNYYGTTLDINFRFYVFPEPLKYTIELKDYIIYVKKGDKKPDFKSYIKNTTANKNNIKIDDSALDMNKDGSYEVLYRVGNDDNSPDGFSRIIVVVGDNR